MSEDGSWKIGSLEHLCRYGDVTASYLKKRKHFRYEKAIPVEEKVCGTGDSEYSEGKCVELGTARIQ